MKELLKILLGIILVFSAYTIFYFIGYVILPIIGIVLPAPASVVFNIAICIAIGIIIILGLTGLLFTLYVIGDVFFYAFMNKDLWSVEKDIENTKKKLVGLTEEKEQILTDIRCLKKKAGI